MTWQKTEDRFVRIYAQGNSFGTRVEIWADKHTGVNYLWQASGYAGGLTPLLNPDGSPVVTPFPRKYEE